jgi:hypothetical protein
VPEQSDHCVQAELRALRREPLYLLLEYLFNLADFLLDFAGEVFVLAFGRQVGVVRDLSGFLFNAAFQFTKLSFDLILRARFHLVSPLLFLGLSTKASSGIVSSIRVAGRGPGHIASGRYARQREYPHPPPPSRNNTRSTINRVDISHLVSIQCNADWGPIRNVCEHKVETRGSRKLRCAGFAVHQARSAEVRRVGSVNHSSTEDAAVTYLVA